MTRYVFNSLGDTLLRKEEGEPVCGEDFCDLCGDCLSCYTGDCRTGGEHWWVVYEDKNNL